MTPTPEARRPRRHRLRRRLAAAAIALLLAVGVPSWWALNRYVVDHVEVANASQREEQVAAEASTGTAASSTDAPQVTVTEHTYGSGSDQATYYVADVVLSDITQLRSAFANDAFGENIVEYPSDIASDVGAAFAVNGDYYGFRTTGIEIRNGVLYRDEGAREGAVIYADGTMDVYDETSTSGQELLDAGAWQTLSFGPGLVHDGQVMDGIDTAEVDTNLGNHSIQGDQPRTAIGMISANHYVFVVVDGRSSESAGVTLTELASIMQDLGATEAYNLDGGGSSTMVSDGSLVNDPLGKGQERGTSDILWVG
ncbi:phosphodiester glycosidase family protein [Demequina soli]|uniref:phosphodiester glycosidase family protein n=1 Tax=Demequina soli TaxID=1638987 RepID=UPI00078023D0|nr:phosphodiester glycosidase family protein [Demequina soli]